MARITDLSPEEVDAFAEMYRTITVKYDNLFQTSFPYSAGIHQHPAILYSSGMALAYGLLSAPAEILYRDKIHGWI